MAHGALAHAVEVVEISWMEARLADGLDTMFTPVERAYAASKTDPARRLAARWAAKVAAARLLGSDARPEDVEVVRGAGAPTLRLHGSAAARWQVLGGGRLHVSLTHGLTHAAASVVLEGPSA